MSRRKTTGVEFAYRNMTIADEQDVNSESEHSNNGSTEKDSSDTSDEEYDPDANDSSNSSSDDDGDGHDSQPEGRYEGAPSEFTDGLECSGDGEEQPHNDEDIVDDGDDEVSNNDDDNAPAHNSFENLPNYNQKHRSASTPMQHNISNQTQDKNIHNNTYQLCPRLKRDSNYNPKDQMGQSNEATRDYMQIQWNAVSRFVRQEKKLDKGDNSYVRVDY